MPFDAEFCCAPGDKCDGPSPGGDGSCALDCGRICLSVTGDPTRSAEFCYHDVVTNTISYNCGMCGVGRVASGTQACERGGTLGERLARQAYYEGASVVAFERLASVLRAHGAPSLLVQRAQRAAADEARHAVRFAKLAAQYGASVPALQLPEHAPSLLELALENATEGCVRETFGALVVLHQAQHAHDAAVRAAFASIADDEAEHAALSWELRAWFESQLSASECAQVDAAHAQACADASGVESAMDEVDLALGLPSASFGAALFRAVMDESHALRPLAA
jgi:hypothetical protein